MNVDSASRNYLFKNASIIAVLSGAGMVSGLLLDALILGVFGVGNPTDALSAALTIPLIIGSVFKAQVPKVLIPSFTDHYVNHGDSSTWDLLSNLLTTSFFALGGVSLVGVFLSGAIMPMQIPGLKADTVSLSIWLSRMLFGLVLLQGLGAILQAVLYARHSYLLSSAGKLVANLLTIATVALCSRQFGIHAVAGGMLLGESIQVVILAWAVSAQGFQYHWILRPTDPRLQEIVRAFRYPLAGHAVAETVSILQNVLSSHLGSGSITLIRYASRIVQGIAGLLLGSIVQVTFPLFSRHAASKDSNALRKTVLESVRILGIVGVPISLWLTFAAEPLLVLLFVRGEFSTADAALTSSIIGFMVPYIFFSRIMSIAQAPFYANLEMRPPLVSTLVFTVTHLVFALALTGMLGLFGLPIALSLASLCSAAYMIVMLQRRFGPIGWTEIRGFTLRVSATSAVAGVGFALGTRLSRLIPVPASLTKLLDFSVPTSVAICAFVAGALVFGLIDGRALWQLGWNRAPFFGRSSS